MVPKTSCPFWLAPVKSHKSLPSAAQLCAGSPGDPSEAVCALCVGGGGTVASNLPHPKVLSLHFQHLFYSLSNGRKKTQQRKGPRALKGFHCSEHLGCWLSRELAGMPGGGHSGTQSHRRNFPSRPPPVTVRVPVRGSLETGASLGVLGLLLPSSAPIPNHLLRALPPAGEQGVPAHGSESEVGWARGAGREGQAPCA